ncbi:hypothetical protein F4811DRAFT_548433 [Daldinia bambusicola]|nr:hypothetical protein F4811DRAFT_548433 [Daldinia bambusicola]
MSCSAYEDGIQCDEATEWSSYCKKHRRQERLLYHYYKQVEYEWEYGMGTGRNSEDINCIEYNILKADVGILGELEANLGIKRKLIETLEQVNEDLPELEFYKLVENFPAIEIVPKDTPNARTRETDLARRKALEPVDWSSDEPLSQERKEYWMHFYDNQEW